MSIAEVGQFQTSMKKQIILDKASKSFQNFTLADDSDEELANKKSILLQNSKPFENYTGCLFHQHFTCTIFVQSVLEAFL